MIRCLYMSPIIVLARTRRLILLPFAAGFDAICIAVVWLDARKSITLEDDGVSLDTPSRDDESDQDRTRGKADGRNQNGLMQHSFATNIRRTRMQDSNSQTYRIDLELGEVLRCGCKRRQGLP